MAEGKKKPIMIGIIVGSIVLAGAITLMTRAPRGEGLKSIPEEKMMWMTCRNDTCGANYEMQMREYYRQREEIQKQSGAMSMSVPALICEKCSEESLYKAFKCQKCELIFEGGAKRGDYEDRCPKCGYSDIKRGRDEKAAGGG